MHNRHKLLHNDLKTDVVLTSIPPAGSIGPVIIDFGKACEISKGRVYNLSQHQRERYKVNHPHIAPDLRDGKCPQSTLSDIFSLGRIMLLMIRLHHFNINHYKTYHKSVWNITCMNDLTYCLSKNVYMYKKNNYYDVNKNLMLHNIDGTNRNNDHNITIIVRPFGKFHVSLDLCTSTSYSVNRHK